MQHQSNPSPPQQSRLHTGRMRAATDTRELKHMDTTLISATSGASVPYDACSKRTLTAVAIERKPTRSTRRRSRRCEKKALRYVTICDGKSGLLGLSPGIPVQMCQFHQIKSTCATLTREVCKAQQQALRALSLTPTETTQVAFEAALKRWVRAVCRLPERTQNEKTGYLPLHA